MGGLIALAALVHWRRYLPAVVACVLATALLAGCSRERTGSRRAPAAAGSGAVADSAARPEAGKDSASTDSGGPPVPGGWKGAPASSLQARRASPSRDAFPADSLDHLSNQVIRWGVAGTRSAVVPRVPASWVSLLDRYGGICLGDTGRRVVFLTFDAGYEVGYTPGLLDALRDEDVRAIFFITGNYLKSQPDLVRRMVAEGHEVGNHTRSHVSMPSLGAAGMRAEMLAVEDDFRTVAGRQMRLFRPPSGELSERLLAVANRVGYVTVMWSLAYKDWEPVPGGPEASYRTVMERLHSGAVILLHVTSKDNAAALSRIIRGTKQQGYSFGTPQGLADLAAGVR